MSVPPSCRGSQLRGEQAVLQLLRGMGSGGLRKEQVSLSVQEASRRRQEQ